MNFISLPKLINLKLASGMTNPRRACDLSDVQDLIAVLGSNSAFADSLDESVQEKFQEFWQAIQEYLE